MAQKETALVILSPLNTLLLVTGMSIVLWTSVTNIWPECFSYAVEDFTTFYQSIFLTFGLILTSASLFGFISMILEKRQMLDFFGKILVTLLLVIFVILWLGLWGTGPMHFKHVMSTSFKAYSTGNWRLDKAIDGIQREFHCCGVDGPGDWTHISALQMRNTTLTPKTCCNPRLRYRTNDGWKCLTTYQSGCYKALRRHMWRMVSVITAVGLGIALLIGLTILPLFRLIKHIENEQNVRSEENYDSYLNSAVHTQVVPLNLHRDVPEVKHSGSSTVV